jgi:hypothetical protein
MIFGFTVSAGGNVLHAQKTPIAIAISLLPPVILALAFELVSRIPMAKERHIMWKSTRIGATSGIALIMAWNSYFHQRDAFFRYTGGDVTASLTLPIAIDGLMIVGSVSLIELGVQIRDLEAYVAAGNRVVKAKPETAPKRKDKEPTIRERVAALLARSPELTISDLAQLTGSSKTYVYNIVNDLNKVSDLQPA